MTNLSEREKILLAAFVGLAIGAGGMYCALDRQFDRLELRMNAIENVYRTGSPSAPLQSRAVQNPVSAAGIASGEAQTPTNTSKDEATLAFSYPYPLVWTERGITYSLTGVSYGYVPATKFVRKSASSSYKEGEIVHALVLYVKLNTSSGGNALLTMRRVLNEEGDMVPPNMDQFYLPGSSGNMMRENTSYADQPIYFLVEPGVKEFIFTTGGTSNKFFTIRTLPNDVLDIVVEP